MVRHKMEVLERHCQAVGRNPETIVKTRLGSLIIRDSDAEARRLLEQVYNRPGIDKERVRLSVIAGA